MNYMKSINPHVAVGTGEEGRVPLEVTGKRKAKQQLVGLDAYDEDKKSTESKLLSSSLPTKKSKKAETKVVPLVPSSSSSSSSKKGPSPMASRTRSKKNAVKK